MDINKFEKWLYFFGISLSLYIIIKYFSINKSFTFQSIYYVNKKWGYGIIPGFPNGNIIPLLVTLWMAFRFRRTVIEIVVLIVALVLTTSRGGLLGGVLIIGYFSLKKILVMENYKLILLILFMSIIVLVVYINITQVKISEIYSNLFFRTYDRFFLLDLFIDYFSKKPFLGYGGNTFDQIVVETNLILPIAHTHNTVMEILLRYGIFGLSAFTLLMVSLFEMIKENDKRFLFVLLMFLSLFQIYIRDFNFLFLIKYLTIPCALNINDNRNLKNERV